jgi:hypothetical protein
MAIANPRIDQYIDDHDLELIPVCDPHEQLSFDEWYIAHSLEQLVDAHSSIKLRWEIIHWVFTVPFVSREYADTGLLTVLQSAVDRFRDSINSDPSAFDDSTCFSVEVQSLDLPEVPFRVTKEFGIAPHPYSFEAVCIRLQVDPEVMRQHVQYMMRVRGIDELIDKNEMAVRAKREAAGCEQQDFLGSVDYSDVKLFVPPIAVPGLLRRKPGTRVAEDTEIAESLDLFTGS